MSNTLNLNSSQPAILLLRDQLLPNLFKEDEADILYWAGKDLARHYTVSSIEELSDLVAQLSFGTLHLKEEKKRSRVFLLKGEIVHERLKTNAQANFSLETGFVAQAIQTLSKHYTEGSYTVNRKTKDVRILLETDPKEPLD